MADRVHAPVNAMQPPRREAMRDRPRLDAERTKLVVRDDAMLPRRQPRDLPIEPGWAEFRTTVVVNSAHPLD